MPTFSLLKMLTLQLTESILWLNTWMWRFELPFGKYCSTPTTYLELSVSPWLSTCCLVLDFSGGWEPGIHPGSLFCLWTALSVKKDSLVKTLSSTCDWLSLPPRKISPAEPCALLPPLLLYHIVTLDQLVLEPECSSLSEPISKFQEFWELIIKVIIKN